MIIWAVSETSIASSVYVARRSWHIDVGIEVADLAAPLVAVADALPGARYVFFGFGDRHYLLAKNHNAPVLLAALWPGSGMMLMTGLSSSPQLGFGAEQVIALKLDSAQMQALQAFIWNTLDSRGGAASPYAPGPYEGSVYFPAATRYWALRTCNTWAAQALRASGLRIRSTGVIFAGQLWSRVQRLKAVQMEPAAGRPTAGSPVTR